MNKDPDEFDETTILTCAVRALRNGTNGYVEALVAELLEDRSSESLSTVCASLPDNFDPGMAVTVYLTVVDEDLSKRALGHLQIALKKVPTIDRSHKCETYAALQRALLHNEDREGRLKREFQPIYERRLKHLSRFLTST